MIGSPSGLHAEHGIAAVERGLHVLVEKPIDVSTVRGEALVATAERAGVKLGVLFQDRLQPDLLRLRDFARGGGLGRVLVASARVKWHRPPEYYSASRWRGTLALDGGAALVNQGIHTVDLLLWLLGPVVRVRGLTATLLHAIEAEDVALALLRFASGALGTLEATTVAFPGYPRRVEISGTEGTVVVEGSRVVAADLRAPAPASSPRETRAGRARPRPIVAEATPHRRMVEDFARAIATGAAPACDGREALRSLMSSRPSTRRRGGTTDDEAIRRKSVGHPSLDLTGKVAVVVGGTAGIGRAFSLGDGRGRRRRRRLRAHRGDGRDDGEGDRGARAGRPSGRPPTSPTAPRSRRRATPSSPRSARSTSSSTARGASSATPILDLSEEEWGGILETNLTGTLRACQVFGRPMIEPRLRAHRERRLAQLVRLLPRGGRLRREQGGGLRAHPVARRRVGAEGRDRERHRARRLPHGPERAAPRRDRARQGAADAHAAQALRPGRGAGRACASSSPPTRRASSTAR